MLSIIGILEKCGQDRDLRRSAAPELERMLLDAEIAPELCTAVASSDPEQLYALVGASHSLCCLVHAPDDDEPAEGEEEEGDDDDDEEERPASE